MFRVARFVTHYIFVKKKKIVYTFVMRKKIFYTHFRIDSRTYGQKLLFCKKVKLKTGVTLTYSEMCRTFLEMMFEKEQCFQCFCEHIEKHHSA